MKFTLITCLAFILLSCGGTMKNGLGLNENASVNDLGDLPENPLLLNPITSSIRPKDSTMSVLYGNEPAYDYAKENGDGNYPAGVVLYEVTWQMQRGDQWFGGNVPENIKKIERVEFLDNNKTEYKSFDSKGTVYVNSDDAQARIDHIKTMKMAVSP